MPIYGYSCIKCEQELEVFQSMADAPLTTCPNCQGRLRKLMYPVGVQFKGSGFYKTDYGNGTGARKAPDGAKAGDGGGKAGQEGGSSGEGGGDKKPADAGTPAASKPESSGKGGGDASAAKAKPAGRDS